MEEAIAKASGHNIPDSDIAKIVELITPRKPAPMQSLIKILKPEEINKKKEPTLAILKPEEVNARYNTCESNVLTPPALPQEMSTEEPNCPVTMAVDQATQAIVNLAREASQATPEPHHKPPNYYHSAAWKL